MTSKEHFDNICSWFKQEGWKKYFRGQVQHSGRLWRKSTLKMLKEEVIDMLVYFHVLQEHHETALDYLALALADWDDNFYLDSIMPNVRNAYNILEFGNPEGILEEEK